MAKELIESKSIVFSFSTISIFPFPQLYFILGQCFSPIPRALLGHVLLNPPFYLRARSNPLRIIIMILLSTVG